MKIEEILAEIDRRKKLIDERRVELTRSQALSSHGAWLALAELELWILELLKYEKS